MKTTSEQRPRRTSWKELAGRARCVALAMLAFATPAMAQEQSEAIAGESWVGPAGVTMTVREIMGQIEDTPSGIDLSAIQPSFEVVNPRPSFDAGLGAFAAWPPLPPGVSPITPPGYGDRSPQVLTTTFLAISQGEANAFPPDPSGDVSPLEILVASNGRIKLFDKLGTLTTLNTTLNTFFNSVRNGATVNGPRIRYDRLSGRWFVAGYTVTPLGTANRVVLAVSTSSNLTDASSFQFYFFQQDLVGTTPNVDTSGVVGPISLGIDANALYIGGNVYNPAGNFQNSSAWVVRKIPLLSGTFNVAAFRNLGTSVANGLYGPQGVHNDDITATEGYFIGTSTVNLGQLVLRRVTNPGSTTPTISGNILLSVPSTAISTSVPAQGSVNIDSGEYALINAHVRKNKWTGTSTLWTSHNTLVNSAGVGTGAGDRTGGRWYEIQNLTGTPTLRQSGTMFDNAAATPRGYFFGSCNVSGQGHMAIGSSFAASDEFAGCAAAGRLSGDTLGTTQAVSVIQSGAAAYQVLSSAGENRWGSFSNTVVDPEDDMTMWTFQEMATGANTWGVRVTKMVGPRPPVITSASPSTVVAGSQNVDVVLTAGSPVSGEEFFDAGGGFNRLSVGSNSSAITVNSVVVDSPTQMTVNLSVTGNASLGGIGFEVFNSDGQRRTSNSVMTITGPCVPPTVAAQPVSTRVCPGINASFTVASNGTPATYQWRRGTTPITNGGPYRNADTATLSIVNTNDAQVIGSDYNCLITNGCGSVSTVNATLTVGGNPTITNQPDPLTQCAGTSASFTVAANTSGTVSYQWRKNTVNIGGATSATYSIASLVVGDAGNYDCVVTDGCGSATSNQAALGVTAGPAISNQTISVTRCEGQSASFFVAASGTGLTYQWRRGTTNIINGGAISGANTSTLTITSTSVTDTRNDYNCVVTGTCGSVTSVSADLTVHSNAVAVSQPAAFQSACVGSPVSFTFVASSTPPPTYQWRRNGVNIAGATNSTYTIAAVASGDGGTYTCIAAGSCAGVTSNNASLVIQTAPSVTTQPTAATACSGSSASFSVVAAGSPPPTYQWRRNGANIAGATAATYTIASVTTGDAGSYDCVLTNPCGSATSNVASLAVNTPPVINGTTGDQVRCEGLTFSMSVGASSPFPMTYQWLKNGAPIPGATASVYVVVAPTLSAEGSYVCNVSNSCGTTPTAPMSLTIRTNPQITQQPAGATRCSGDSVTFAIAANSSSSMVYRWYRDATLVQDSLSPSLTIPAVSGANAGNYTCRVVTSCITVTSTVATLVVQSAPSITTQPASQTVSTGASASLSVVAAGSGPLTYAWRKNSTPLTNSGVISGANTPTLTISPASASDSGNYDVLITNACGNVTSTAATLTVSGCVADFDDGSGTGTPDGGVTIDDLLYYLVIFESGVLAADVDDGSNTGTHDGGVTIDDLLYFLVRFEAGC